MWAWPSFFKGKGTSARIATSIAESRERFVEATPTILQGLERGYCAFEGKFVQQRRRELHARGVGR